MPKALTNNNYSIEGFRVDTMCLRFQVEDERFLD